MDNSLAGVLLLVPSTMYLFRWKKRTQNDMELSTLAIWPHFYELITSEIILFHSKPIPISMTGERLESETYSTSNETARLWQFFESERPTESEIIQLAWMSTANRLGLTCKLFMECYKLKRVLQSSTIGHVWSIIAAKEGGIAFDRLPSHLCIAWPLAPPITNKSSNCSNNLTDVAQQR